MRQAMGVGEVRLWARLRMGRLEGLRFRRQVPIGPYIVDFLCLDRRLVVEVDGGQHAEDQHAQADAVRTAWLVQAGFRVVRFWTSEVKENVEGVCTAILEAAADTPHALR